MQRETKGHQPRNHTKGTANLIWKNSLAFMDRLCFSRLFVIGLFVLTAGFASRVQAQTPVLTIPTEERYTLHPGDVLLALNGKKIQNAADVVDYVATQPIGTSVRAEYLRNGKPGKVDIALGELQSEEARKAHGVRRAA